MGEPENKSSSLPYFVIAGVIFCFFAVLAIPNFVRDPWTAPANACINNMRRIGAAKDEWALEQNAKTNDVVTLNDIKPYLNHELDPNSKPYIKLDSKGNLSKCPSGGTYTIGKVGEPPTCSLGTNVIPPHVLQ